MPKEGAISIPILSAIPGFPDIPDTGIGGLDGVLSAVSGTVSGVLNTPFNLVGSAVGGLINTGGGSSNSSSNDKEQPKPTSSPTNAADEVAAIRDRLLREYHENKIAKSTTYQQLCCAHDPRLKPYNVQDEIRSATGNVFAVENDITPREYCGEYWERGGACDATMKTYCETYPGDDLCSCITGTDENPNDSEASKIYKRSPYCFNPTCQSYGYKPSRFGDTINCPSVQFCDQNFYSNGENNAIVSAFIKQKCGDSVETTPDGILQPVQPQPVVNNNILYFLIFLIFVVLGVVLYKLDNKSGVSGGIEITERDVEGEIDGVGTSSMSLSDIY